MTSAAQLLQARLGLSDEELCTVLDVDALSLIGDQLDHRPELAILLALTEEAGERVGPASLRAWVRRGAPLRHLLARDFGAFEDDLAELGRRGFVVRRDRGG